MATVVVTAANTNNRVNDSNSATNWANAGSGGGPSPASEAPLAYQGGLTVNQKQQNTARRGIQYDPASGAVDMTAAANRLWLIKCYIADFADLNATYGCEIRLGSSNSAYYQYNVAGSAAKRAVFSTYPAQGGYLLIALDPNISGWRDATVGSPDLTAVDYFAFLAAMIAGNAKSENLALDAIDVGTGLQLYAGDGGSADGTYQDFVTADQGTVNNRWGYVSQVAGMILVRGMLVIGRNNTTPTATEFVTSTDTVIVYPDGYHSAGLFGTTVDLGHSSTLVTISNTQIGRGSITTEDTRPDFIFTGTSGSASVSATLTNFRNITLTSTVDVDGANIQCKLLTQASGEIQNSIVRTLSLTNVATLVTPTLGTTSGLHDTEFVETGAGHALEFTTTGSKTLTGITFTDYGGTPGSNLTSSSGASDAAVLNSSGGLVTLNITGGNSPSVRNTASSTTLVVNTVSVVVNVTDENSSALQNARVWLEADTGGDLPAGETVTSISRSGSTATVSHTAHGIPDGTDVVIRGAVEDEYNGQFTITSTGANSYTYTVSGTPSTPATGTITSTSVIINELTTAGGVADNTAHSYTSDQPVIGWVRKATSSPYYKNAGISGTILTSGLTINVKMVRDG